MIFKVIDSYVILWYLKLLTLLYWMLGHFENIDGKNSWYPGSTVFHISIVCLLIFKTLFAYIPLISEWHCYYHPVIFQSPSKHFLHDSPNTGYAYQQCCWLWNGYLTCQPSFIHLQTTKMENDYYHL